MGRQILWGFLVTILLVIVTIMMLWSISTLRMDPLDHRAAIAHMTLPNLGIVGCQRDINYKRWTKFWQFVGLPLKGNSFEHFSEGVIYSSLYRANASSEFEKAESKVFWDEFFTKHRVPHPPIVASCMKGNLSIDKKNYQKGHEYIIKPTVGMMACDIHTSTDLKSEDCSFDWIAQKRLVSIDGVSNHYRVITLHDGTVFCSWHLSSQSKNIAVSNHSAGGKIEFVPQLDAKAAALARKIAIIHKQQFPSVFSIGWDFMWDVVTQKYYVLEGNLIACIWFYPEPVPDWVIPTYKSKLGNFINRER